MPQYTPTESRIIHLLSDGMAHPKQQIRDCLNDEMSENSSYMIISNLRKKLLPIGQTIVCETTGRATFYRHVRLLTSPHRD